VSWSYALYEECGRINVRFLKERFVTYGLDASTASRHLENVQNLRTILQQHLNSSLEHDTGIETECAKWYREACGTAVPAGDAHWESGLRALLIEGIDFLKLLCACIREIEKDDAREGILMSWEKRITRYHGPHEFDRIIEIAANDLGRDSLDAVRLRKRFYDKWVKELDNLADGYDFEREARRLVEHTLLSDLIPVLPITGDDIVREFGIQPGEAVGEFLRKARCVYDETPCSREELIGRLKSNLTDTHGTIAKDSAASSGV
jgi:hypothetical protein